MLKVKFARRRFYPLPTGAGMLYEQVSGGGMPPEVYAPGTNHALLYALRAVLPRTSEQ